MSDAAVRVDAHQHFWRYTPEGYPWIDESMAPLRRDFLPGDLHGEIAAAGIDVTIAVQAQTSEAETSWLLDLAAAHPFIAGVVGWTDFCADDAPAAVERLARQPRLVGLRHVVQSEPDDRFLVREDFCRGIAALDGTGLVYDILIYPRQLPAAIEFVGRFPSQPFVLDHLAKPPIRSGGIDVWARDLERLAGAPNVACKASGLVTEADWRAWRPEQVRPYLDVAFDCFGPDRLIAGSDWPVCTVAATYRETMALVRDYVDERAPHARDAILGGNAARLWKVQLPTSNSQLPTPNVQRNGAAGGG